MDKFEELLSKLSEENPHSFFFHTKEIISKESIRDAVAIAEKCCPQLADTINGLTDGAYKIHLASTDVLSINDVTFARAPCSYSYTAKFFDEDVLLIWDTAFINETILHKDPAKAEEIRPFDLKIIDQNLSQPFFTTFTKVFSADSKSASEKPLQVETIQCLSFSPLFSTEGLMFTFEVTGENSWHIGCNLYFPEEAIKKLFDNGILNLENEICSTIRETVEGNAFVSVGECDISDDEELKVGEVIPVNKLAGEFVDLVKNGRKLAYGELVVIDEHMGIRIARLANGDPA